MVENPHSWSAASPGHLHLHVSRKEPQPSPPETMYCDSSKGTQHPSLPRGHGAHTAPSHRTPCSPSPPSPTHLTERARKQARKPQEVDVAVEERPGQAPVLGQIAGPPCTGKGGSWKPRAVVSVRRARRDAPEHAQVGSGVKKRAAWWSSPETGSPGQAHWARRCWAGGEVGGCWLEEDPRPPQNPGPHLLPK